MAVMDLIFMTGSFVFVVGKCRAPYNTIGSNGAVGYALKLIKAHQNSYLRHSHACVQCFRTGVSDAGEFQLFIFRST